MRGFVISYLFILCNVCFSQHFMPIQHDTIHHDHELIFSGLGNYSGTSIRVDLARKLFYGGNIDQDLKDASLLNHKGINRFGLNMNSEFEYRNFAVDFLKKENLGFLIKGGAYSYFDVLYPKGVYDLAFYGNSQFGGESISLSGTRANAYFFQKIGFGIINKSKTAGAYQSSISLNLVNLSNYASLSVSSGEMYQSSNFDTVSIGANAKSYLLNSSSLFNGLGACVDADFRIPVLTPKDDTIYFQFQINNLGFAVTNNQVSKYETDKSLVYSGIDVSNAINNGGITNNGFSILDSIGVEESQVQKMVLLPGFLQISKLIDESSSKTIEEFYGVRMFFSAAYNPLAFAGLNFKLGKGFNLGGSISYGGLSTFRGGMYTSYTRKNLSIGMSTENLSGIFFNNAKGESIIFRLRCAF